VGALPPSFSFFVKVSAPWGMQGAIWASLLPPLLFFPFREQEDEMLLMYQPHQALGVIGLPPSPFLPLLFWFLRAIYACEFVFATDRLLASNGLVGAAKG